jgi:prepilin-type N-terminal cleavage/methylation domain-containing protein
MIAAAHDDCGFTLLELLVVMAIIGLLSGLAAAVMPQRLSGAQTMRLQGDLMVWLKNQQQRSVERNESVAISATQHGLNSQDGAWLALGQGDVQVRGAPLIFYPDGSASDSNILVRSGDSDIRVAVHGLTGQVEAVK